MDIDLISNVLYATLRTGTPLLLVALGELVCEKSGVLNLGQEGMMLMGAVCGFAIAVNSDSLLLGFSAGMAAGMALALLFGFITLTLNANQVATGLAVAIFGAGLASFFGTGYTGEKIEGLGNTPIPLLANLPLLGEIFFQQDIVVYLSWVLAALLYWVFRSGRLGLTIRAIGEDPDAANAIGLSVLKVRYLCVAFGGAMAGLAGAYLSLAYSPLWTDGMTAGRGWIALGLVVFASWRVGRLILGAYLFGMASIFHLVFQGLGVAISSNLLAMLPYLATIIALVLLSSTHSKVGRLAPAALAKPWHRSH